MSATELTDIMKRAMAMGLSPEAKLLMMEAYEAGRLVGGLRMKVHAVTLLEKTAVMQQTDPNLLCWCAAADAVREIPNDQGAR